MKLKAYALTMMVSLVIACAPTDNPGSVAIDFVKRVGTYDFTGAAELATEGSRGGLLVLSELTGLIPKSQIDQQKELVAKSVITVKSSDIRGEKATVVLLVNEQERTLNLEKESGDWKVVFDKESLTQN